MKRSVYFPQVPHDDILRQETVDPLEEIDLSDG